MGMSFQYDPGHRAIGGGDSEWVVEHECGDGSSAGKPVPMNGNWVFAGYFRSSAV
jgi:hypothetical protein